jgi:hypothetical protein
MPQRTNDFQKLIALIERALAPNGARITESAMVLGEDGESREIDILIESPLGPYAIKIAVEAKNEGRKMDLVRFESIVGKYRSAAGIKVNHVVVISKSGFTRTVERRAQREAVELLTLVEAMEVEWGTLPSRIVLAIPPHIARFDFEPALKTANFAELIRRARLRCKCCGKLHMTLWQIAEQILQNRPFTFQLRVAASHANQGACQRATIRIPQRFELDYFGSRHPIRNVTIHFHCTQARGDLAIRKYLRGDTGIQHLSGDVGGKRIDFVIPDGPEPHKIAFRIEQSAQLPTLNTNIDPLPLPPPMPAAFATLRDEIRRCFSSFDVSVSENELSHNFATGCDTYLPWVLDFSIGGRRGCRTAVFPVALDHPLTIDRVKELVALMEDCELDKLVIWCPAGLTEGARAMADREGLRHLSDSSLPIAQFVDLFAPDIVLFNLLVKDMSIQFIGPSPMDAGSIVRGVLLPDGVELGSVGLGEAVAHHLKNAISEQVFSSVVEEQVAQCWEITFEADFGANAAVLTSDARSRELHRISGTATVTTVFAFLKRKSTVVTEGAPAIRWSSDREPFEVSATTAWLPQNNHVQFDTTGASLHYRPAGKFKARLSVYDFEGSGIPERDPSKAIVIATIPEQSLQGTATLQLMKMRDFRRASRVMHRGKVDSPRSV